MYYIQEGKVRLSVPSKRGEEATIALLGLGDFLGEGCVASDQPIRLATATAITNCTLLRIHKKELLRARRRWAQMASRKSRLPTAGP